MNTWYHYVISSPVGGHDTFRLLVIQITISSLNIYYEINTYKQIANMFIRCFIHSIFFGTRGPLKRSFHSRFKLAHSFQKKPNLHTNSLNKLLLKSLSFCFVNFWASKTFLLDPFLSNNYPNQQKILTRKYLRSFTFIRDGKYAQ
jgi:hypothetical protein